MENAKLLITPSPHFRGPRTTQKIMLDVIIALLPALAASAFIFGLRALLVVAFCVAVSVVSEWGFEAITKRPITITDLSACVTGMILGLNLPSNIPLWQAAFGSAFAIIAVKQLFGGIGKNFANPALTARIVMLLSFSEAMSDFARKGDAVSSATPLTVLQSGNTEAMPTLLELFLGTHGGSLGETCALALVIGLVYLLARRVITWHIPVCFVGTVFLFTLALGGGDITYATQHVLTGGLLIGAVFMATDYSTSPSTPWGKVIFGIGCGLITVLIRVYGSYPEGVSFALLFMNILNPYICMLTRKRPFGAKKAEKKKIKGGEAAK